MFNSMFDELKDVKWNKRFEESPSNMRDVGTQASIYDIYFCEKS